MNEKAGGELTDFIIVLRTVKDVKAFCSRVHFSMGAGVSAAAGPVGRAAEADIRAGDRGAATCYTYSCSKGEYTAVGCFHLNVCVDISILNTKVNGYYLFKLALKI